VPDDYRTVWRYNFPFDESVDAFTVDTRLEGKFDTGPLAHTLLAGVDYRKYENQQGFGFALAPPIDLFNPVYGADIVTPAVNPFVDQVQKQTGYYLQDQIKWDRLIVTLSGRQDEVKADNFGDRQGRRRVHVSRGSQLRVRERFRAVRAVRDLVPADVWRAIRGAR
jgi:iron complex outermembrane receptor protein